MEADWVVEQFYEIGHPSRIGFTKKERTSEVRRDRIGAGRVESRRGARVGSGGERGGDRAMRSGRMLN